MTETQIKSISQGGSPAPFKVTEYLKDIRAELRNVTWPDRAHVIRASAVVIALCVGMSAVVGVVDYGLTIGLVWFNRVL